MEGVETRRMRDAGMRKCMGLYGYDRYRVAEPEWNAMMRARGCDRPAGRLRLRPHSDDRKAAAMNILYRCAAILAVAFMAAIGGATADAAKQLKKRQVQIDARLGYVLARIGPTLNARGRAPHLYLWRFDPARGEIAHHPSARSGAGAARRG